MLKENRGHIWVESETGMGSSFTLTLPIQRLDHSALPVNSNESPKEQR
jgi:signal transduction histidine kinase